MHMLTHKLLYVRKIRVTILTPRILSLRGKSVNQWSYRLPDVTCPSSAACCRISTLLCSPRRAWYEFLWLWITNTTCSNPEKHTQKRLRGEILVWRWIFSFKHLMCALMAWFKLNLNVAVDKCHTICSEIASLTNRAVCSGLLALCCLWGVRGVQVKSDTHCWAMWWSIITARIMRTYMSTTCVFICNRGTLKRSNSIIIIMTWSYCTAL